MECIGNKFLFQKCKDIALKDLGDKNIFYISL